MLRKFRIKSKVFKIFLFNFIPLANLTIVIAVSFYVIKNSKIAEEYLNSEEEEKNEQEKVDTKKYEFENIPEAENKFISNFEKNIDISWEDEIWLNNSKWTSIFQEKPQQIPDLLKKFPYFENSLFNNDPLNEALINLHSFFRNEIKKNFKTHIQEFDIITDQKKWQNKKISNNFSIIKNKKDFFSIFTNLENKKFYKRVLSNPEFFNKKAVVVFIKPGEIFANWRFKENGKNPVLEPAFTYKNSKKNDQIGIISYDNKFWNFFYQDYEYRDIESGDAVRPAVIRPSDFSFQSEIYQDHWYYPKKRPSNHFFIFYKIIDKSDINKFNNDLDIHIDTIEDLILYNRIERSKTELENFQDFLLKKQQILGKNPLKTTRLYAMIKENETEIASQKIYSDYQVTKDLLENKNLGKSWEWGDAFHISNLFNPAKNGSTSAEFNKFILKKQNANLIFDDEILYSKIDHSSKKIKIYTFNFKDLFPKFAVEPANFKIEKLAKFTKVDFGNSNLDQIEYIKIKSLSEFDRIYNELVK
ncbi:Uncharacterised protein [Mesomycoplasma dispar]|uniref:Uncharacterized protein n=1 Tax=Mesomycoplasma dispar TaxID=86660 RepID=A0AAJ5NSI4_9BACT|nr:hypothetical protein [Mesomycoplasma dispar]AJR12267.1 hypothetical protein MDIS_02490 [Mesomycoplasma dispar]VEU61978.1 Uncharacterised protein [Mesomycoplasma dispar]